MLKQFDRSIAGQPLARFPHEPLPSARRLDLELAQLNSPPRNLAISGAPTKPASWGGSWGPRNRPGEAGPTRTICALKDLNQC